MVKTPKREGAKYSEPVDTMLKGSVNVSLNNGQLSKPSSLQAIIIFIIIIIIIIIIVIIIITLL